MAKPMYLVAFVVFVLSLAADAIGEERGLVRAARLGDLGEVMVFLAQGAAPDAQDEQGATALHWASDREDVDMLDSLIDAGANPKATNRRGVTPLWLASRNGNVAIMRRLLDAGAEPNDALPGGETALMTAARTGVVDAVDLLLGSGADPNAVESTRGQTALMWAAAQKHRAVVDRLVAAGSNLQVGSSKTGLTALMFAIRAGGIETTRLLLDAGADLTQQARDGTSPLVLAIINAHFELARVLLDRGADPNTVDNVRGHVLHVVAFVRGGTNVGLATVLPRVPTGDLDSLELARTLLERGANPNMRIDWEELPVSNNAAAGFARAPKDIALRWQRA